MVTKRDLGIGYLLGSGLGLMVSIVGRIVLVNEPIGVSLLGSATAILLAGSVLYVGFWLKTSDLGGEHVWTIAAWSALGLSIPTGLGVLLTVVRIQPPLQFLFPSLLINNLAAGGVAGVLLGTALELRRANKDKTELYQRNVVLNRVLRHNIRNDMNVILGYAHRLERADNGSHDDLVEPIRRKAQDVVELSKSARRIDSLDTATNDGPIDAVRVINDRLRVARSSYPGVGFDVDLPEAAWVDAGPMFASVVDNIIENAIEHNDQEPAISVAVSGREPGTVSIRIADNGPGIPPGERVVVTDDLETPIEHGTGLGLWLVRWFVDTYDGELRLEENEPRGTVVTIRLPAAEAPATASKSSRMAPRP